MSAADRKQGTGNREQGTGAATAMSYGKPLPEVSPVSKPFWDAAKEHRLVLQRSRRTGKYVFYPRAVSPFGAGDTLEWVTASGRGIVFSFTVARRPTAPQWASDGDYAIAIIELQEGVHMTANVVDCDPDTVRVGTPVEVVFADVTPDVTLVQWRPVA